MPVIIVCIIGLFAVVGFQLNNEVNFKKDILKFESRCTIKGGLTLQAYKAGNQWIGCYKNGVELENEQ